MRSVIASGASNSTELIGAHSLALTEAPPELLAADATALFLNDYGEPAHADFISAKVKRYMAFAGVEKVGSAHLLRHACATHMLEGGADIRFIKEMLGHANIETTEIYTHVSIDKLIAVHRPAS